MRKLEDCEIAEINGGSWQMTLATGWAGVVAGAAAGSVIPGAGTLAGAVVGGIVGIGSGLAYSFATDGRDNKRVENFDMNE